MPNIASVLKEEILRLARKEVRAEVESLRKASAQYRSEIAELKRRVTSLEKQAARQAKRSASDASSESGAEQAGPRLRFRPKGLATHRERLGLSAAEAGLLLGVSAQTIYHWESGKSKPRASQLDAIAAFRKMGKRAVRAKLAEPPQA